MKKKNDTVRYRDKEIKAMIARGEDRTNWAKTDEVTGARLEESIRADVDEAGSEPDWTQSIIGVPPPKDHINIRVDHDVLEWFRSNGRGYQTLMNNVLRGFMQARQDRKVPIARQKKIILPVSRTRGGARPGVDLDNNASLLDVMEDRS